METTTSMEGSIDMKKLGLYLLAVLSIMTACTREEAPESIETNESNATTITVVAGKAGTRTYLEENDGVFSFKWKKGDRIALVEGCPAFVDNQCETYKSEPLSVDAEEAVFTVNLGERESLPGQLCYTAIYPPHYDNDWEYPIGYYDEAGRLFLGLEFPTDQYPTADSFDPLADLLVSKAIYADSRPGNKAHMNFEFARVGTIVKMVLTGLPTGSKIYNGSLGFDFEAGYYLEYYPAQMVMKSSDGTLFMNFDYGDDGLSVGLDGTAVVWLRCMSGVSKRIDLRLDGWTPDVGSWHRYRPISFRARGTTLSFKEGGLTEFTVNINKPDVENPEANTVQYWTNSTKDRVTVSWPDPGDEDLAGYDVFLLDENDTRYNFNTPVLSSDGTCWNAVIGQDLAPGEYTLFLRANARTGKVSQPDFMEKDLSIGVLHNMTIGQSSLPFGYTADEDNEASYYDVNFGFRNIYPGSFYTMKGTSYVTTWALWNKTPMHLETFSVLPYDKDANDFQLYASDEPFVGGYPSGNDSPLPYTLDDYSKRRDFQVGDKSYFLLTSGGSLQMKNIEMMYCH